MLKFIELFKVLFDEWNIKEVIVVVWYDNIMIEFELLI